MADRVLIVDDDRELCEWLRDALRRRQFEVEFRTSAAEALEAVAEERFDAVVSDVQMRGMNGIDFCARVTADHPDLPVLVITAFGSMETAIAAIRGGAHDFLPKPFEIEELALRLGRAIEHRLLRAEVTRLRRTVSGEADAEGLLGSSLAMRRLRDTLRRLEGSDAPVLITGETGTGKELVARAVHRQSARRDQPFVAVNCPALPESLIESELFGHVRGAFTDARNDREGLLQRAKGGTVFLDEIGDLPLSLQPKLLRVLQERRVRAVGSEEERPFEARIVAATNRDLEAAVDEGRFRADLFFRLDVLRLELPALRARGNDVLELAQHFTRGFALQSGKRVHGLSDGAAAKLLAYSWPGNVRELQNCIERAVALAHHDLLLAQDLPERIRKFGPSHVLVASEDPGELVPLEEVERRYIARVLDAVGGNKTLAARILGLDRKTLYRKLERAGAKLGS